MQMTIDATDSQILANRQAAFDQHPGPRVGDYILFADGVERRISDAWNSNYQTSDDGRWFLVDQVVGKHLPIRYPLK